LLPPSPEPLLEVPEVPEVLEGLDDESLLELPDEPESLLVGVDSLDGLESLDVELLELFAPERLSVL
jgi:hypothetical protein